MPETMPHSEEFQDFKAEASRETLPQSEVSAEVPRVLLKDLTSTLERLRGQGPKFTPEESRVQYEQYKNYLGSSVEPEDSEDWGKQLFVLYRIDQALHDGRLKVKERAPQAMARDLIRLEEDIIDRMESRTRYQEGQLVESRKWALNDARTFKDIILRRPNVAQRNVAILEKELTPYWNFIKQRRDNIAKLETPDLAWLHRLAQEHLGIKVSRLVNMEEREAIWQGVGKDILRREIIDEAGDKEALKTEREIGQLLTDSRLLENLSTQKGT